MSKKQKKVLDNIQKIKVKTQQKGDDRKYLKDLKELREQKDIELFDSLELGIF